MPESTIKPSFDVVTKEPADLDSSGFRIVAKVTAASHLEFKCFSIPRELLAERQSAMLVTVPKTN